VRRGRILLDAQSRCERTKVTPVNRTALEGIVVAARHTKDGPPCHAERAVCARLGDQNIVTARGLVEETLARHGP